MTPEKVLRSSILTYSLNIAVGTSPGKTGIVFTDGENPGAAAGHISAS